MSNKVVLSINVTEKGEAGSREFVALIPQFDIRADHDTAIGAVTKATSMLKKHALRTAIDEEISEQETLPLEDKKRGRKAKADDDETDEAA